MSDRKKVKRLLEPNTSNFEFLEVTDGTWYRRGPPCPTCGETAPNGILLSDKESPGEESCAVCTTIIQITDAFGPRQTGRVRVHFPPDSEDLGSNPYLNPMRSSGKIPDFQEAMVAAGLLDVGNGRRLAIRFGEQLRYTSGWGWLVYDGRRWLRDDIGTAVRMVKATLEECLAMVDQTPYGFWSRMEEEYGCSLKEFKAIIQSSFSRGKIESALAMAQSEPNITARVEEFDQEGWLLNCKNGVVDLTTGTLRPHDPQLYITQLVAHDYPVEGSPEANRGCPRWEAFLLEVCCGDQDLVDFLQRAIGYTLTGDTREQKLFFLYGDGANGKSTFLEVLRYLLGDYSTHLSFEALLKSRNQSPEQSFAHLPGKRYATASEAGEARSWNEEAVKSITGGDTVRAKVLYQDTFEFRPVAKIWLAANDRPRIEGVNEGIWRRFFLIPFTAEIPLERRDPNLLQALKDEAPAILAWAVRGANRWYREGLRNAPASLNAAIEEYRSDNDAVARWMADCCDVGQAHFDAGSTDLLTSYNTYAKANHERELTQTAFGTRLAKATIGKAKFRLTKSRGTGGRIRWHGIMLKQSSEREDRKDGLDAY
jgi:putative DNA primase/helicase